MTLDSRGARLIGDPTFAHHALRPAIDDFGRRRDRLALDDRVDLARELADFHRQPLRARVAMDQLQRFRFDRAAIKDVRMPLRHGAFRRDVDRFVQHRATVILRDQLFVPRLDAEQRLQHEATVAEARLLRDEIRIDAAVADRRLARATSRKRRDRVLPDALDHAPPIEREIVFPVAPDEIEARNSGRALTSSATSSRTWLRSS